MTLAGKHALVTGGGSGIGAEIANMFARHGATVTIVGRRQKQLGAVTQNTPAIHAQVADVTDRVSLDNAVESAGKQHGPISIVVANAGAANSVPFARMSADQWQRDLDVNLTGVFNTFQCGFAQMKDAGWGRLVAVASTAGLKGYSYVSAYCAAKHGVVGLTRALALELAGHGITVNAVCPGFTETPMLEAAVQNIVAKTAMSREAAQANLLRQTPLGRFVTPREVAAAVNWLCGEDADAVTGQAIAVAGGEI